MKHTEFQMRMQEREVKAKQLKASIAKRPVAQVRRLTQEELLEEAKVTEKLNLASLGKWIKAKQLKASIAKRPVAQVRRLTQEELLEEAKVTEKLNLASLGKWI